MRRLLTTAIMVLPVLLADCGDDSTGPEEEAPTSFSRTMWTANGNTGAADCVVTSDGLRVVAGGFQGTLHISGSPDSMTATGGADMFLAAFRRDGSLAWKNHVGGGAGFPGVYRVARDSDNNIYVAGAHYGTVNLGGTDYPGAGFSDALVLRLDATGNLVWALSGMGPTADNASDIAVAPDGSVYVCGLASSEMSLAGEDIGYFGGKTGYLVKIRPNGVGIWSATAVGPGSNISSIALAAGGAVLLCGTYGGGPIEIGREILPLDGAGASFITRLGSVGEPLGNIRTGGTGSVYASRITQIDNEPVVAGSFFGTVDFDVTGSGGEVSSQGDSDAFIARYNQDGTLAWLKTFGDFDDEAGWGIVRTGGQLLLLGIFEQYLPIGSKVLVSRGNTDVFLARFDGAGRLLGSKQMGGSGYDDAPSATWAGDALLMTGRLTSALTFPDGSSITPMTTQDGYIHQEP